MIFRTLTLLLFIQLAFASTYAGELYSATLTYTDGTVQEVSIEFPLDANKKTVTIKKPTGEEVKIDSELLHLIEMRTSEGKEYTFERIQLLAYGAKQLETKPVGKTKGWAILFDSDPKMSYYIIGAEYKVKKKSQDLEIVPGAYVAHAFMRPGEAGATALQSSDGGGGVMIGQAKFFQRAQAAYFRDSPELVERILSDEFKKDLLDKLMEAYCE